MKVYLDGGSRDGETMDLPPHIFHCGRFLVPLPIRPFFFENGTIGVMETIEVDQYVRHEPTIEEFDRHGHLLVFRCLGR